MDRRGFLKRLAGFGLLSGLFGMVKPAAGTVNFILVPNPLKGQLLALADPKFAPYARSKTLQGLTHLLLDKGVLSVEQGVRHDIVAALAQQEPQLLYQGFFYTPTELDLYALAYLASQSSTPALP